MISSNNVEVGLLCTVCCTSRVQVVGQVEIALTKTTSDRNRKETLPNRRKLDRSKEQQTMWIIKEPELEYRPKVVLGPEP